MMITKNCYVLLFVLLFAAGCKDKSYNVPIESDKTAPGPVQNVKVEPLSGAVKVVYSIPDDPDLLCVLAQYAIRADKSEEMTASLYMNNMVLEGFRDTVEYPVTLYAVDRSGNRSEPVEIMVKPLLSPVTVAYNQLSYTESFGGIKVNFINESKSNLIFSVIKKDSLGFWEDYDWFYTSQQQGDFAVRGLPATPTVFGVSVKDKWGNHSDTLVQELTPIFEEELDYSKFRFIELPSDMDHVIWDVNGLWAGGNGGFHSPDNAGFPGWFTFDMGVTAKLSRFKMWGLTDGREFSGGHAKRFQVWGSTDPASDGSFDGWTLMQDCVVNKPSGLPSGELSNEDIELARAGFEFEIPLEAPEVRYIRIKVLSSFSQPENSSTGSFWLRRFAFWGSSR